ncbi:hypothetical protein ACM66B_003541 [Microbotryomycetes sp. NB124-2]
MLQWLAILALLVGIVMHLKSKNMYEGDEVSALNADGEGTTRWFNMGLWTGREDTFAQAAERLFVALADALGPLERASVLELGSGYGEGARVLCAKGVARVVQVTASKTHAHYANRHSAERVTCLAGDAVAALRNTPDECYNAVLAVDCAYHFRSRLDMQLEAHRVLKPKGRLAMTDLLLKRGDAMSWLDLCALRAVLLLARVPWSNMVTADEYLAQLRQQGWTDIELVDISDKVYPGFIDYVARCGNGEPKVTDASAWKGLQRYSRVVKWYSNPSRPLLGFYTVSAAKP